MDEESQSSGDKRSQHRSSIFLAAVLRAGSEQAPVKVRNMSPNGAMLESPLTPSPGTKVQLIRGSLVAHGTVVWSSNNRCGLRFSSDLLVKDWLAAPTKAEQQRVDEIVALAKSGMLPPSPPPELVDERPVQGNSEELVHHLGAVVRLLEDLEDDLASSSETLGRHAEKLQNLDIAMQIVRAIAQDLSGTDQAMAKLEDLRVVATQALSRS